MVGFEAVEPEPLIVRPDAGTCDLGDREEVNEVTAPKGCVGVGTIRRQVLGRVLADRFEHPISRYAAEFDIDQRFVNQRSEDVQNVDRVNLSVVGGNRLGRR